MWRWLVLGAAVLAACEPIEPCDDYVDYMCLCHGDDPDVDCDALGVTYESADPDVQDECAVLLDEQQEADENAGLECAY
jgi:hypothetical protein